jgi:hypothetical protein
MQYLQCFVALLLLGRCWGYSERFRPTIDVGAYRLEHMSPVIGSYFSGNVTSDTLTCFGNNDVEECSYLHTFICMLPGLKQAAPGWVGCDSLWGSRSVVVEVSGSVELLRVNELPEENSMALKGGAPLTSIKDQGSTLLSATRWLEIQTVARNDRVWKKEVKHIPSEPFYLCARSNDWQREDSSMRIEFRPSYFRDTDYNWVIKKTLVHIFLVVAVSSMWLLPYIAAVVTCIVTFVHGFDYYLFALVFSGAVVSLTPFMFTKRHKHLAKLYLRYFFQRKQAREVRSLMRERLPLFQALYFSCAAMSIGGVAGFCIYSYLGIDREIRNTIYKTTLALSTAWLAFFLCRTFERFFRRWSWVLMTYALTLMLELHLNPESKNEAVVAIILLTFAVDWFLVPKIDLNARIGRRDFKGVHWVEAVQSYYTSIVSLPSSSSSSSSSSSTSARKQARRVAAAASTAGYSTSDLDTESEAPRRDNVYGDDDDDDDDDDNESSDCSGGSRKYPASDIDCHNAETPPRGGLFSSLDDDLPIVNRRGSGSGRRGSKQGQQQQAVGGGDNNHNVLPRTPGGTPVYNITINLTVTSPDGRQQQQEGATEELVQQVQVAVKRALESSSI